MSALAVPNANGNLFEIKTMQSSVIRTLVEALKEILTEANLEFDSTGIKIIAMDETHTVLVYLQLLAERFVQGGGEYYCPSKHVLGINMIYLFKLIRTMGNNDTLTLYLPANNPNKLGIRMENSETATTTNYFLKIFDTNVDEIQIPSLTFTSIITMSSSEFQKQCRDMKGLGDDVEKVEITSTGGELYFRCIGDFAEAETVRRENNSMKVVKNSGKSGEIVQGIFHLKHLVLFTKCTNLCQRIEMYLKNDFPLIILYTVGNLGTVKLVLAPIKSK